MVFKRSNSRSLIALGQTFFARAMAGFAGIAMTVVIARQAGPDALGQITFAFGLATTIALFASGGLDICLLKEVARRIVERKTSLLPAFLFDTIRSIIPSTMVLVGAVMLLVFSDLIPVAENRTAFSLLCTTFPLALLAVGAGYLKATRRSAAAALIDIPSLPIYVAVPLWFFYLAKIPLDAFDISIVFVVTAWIIALATTASVFRNAIHLAEEPSYSLSRSDRAQYRQGRFFFLLTALTTFITQAGAFVIAGPFLTDADLGIARGAQRLALLAIFPSTVVNPFIAPRIIDYSTRGDKSSLRSLVFKSCLASTIPSLPVVFFLLAFPEISLTLFGKDFVVAHLPLRIMAAVQIFSSLTAPITQLLFLNGFERPLTQILSIVMFSGFLLFPILSAWFGTEGFALAYGIITIARACSIVALAIRTKSLNPDAP